MSQRRSVRIVATLLLAATALAPGSVKAQPQPARQPAAPADDALKAAPPLTRLFAQDAYTEYALLDDPSSAAFRILFMPLETRAGATILINGTRHGSEGGEVSVWDPRTGKPLKFEYIGGSEALSRKIPGNFTPEDHYIVAQLPRPVPEGGEGRVLIEKTYKDARTYYPEGPSDIVWVRALGAQRFGVILPKGYSLVSANIASQMMILPDGRLKLALTNPSGGGSPITIRARKTNTGFVGNAIADKVYDDTKTLYDLGDPETHTFRVEQTGSDYRKGDKARLDILSHVPLQDLQVIDLDTAKPLQVVREGSLAAAKLEVPIVEDKQSARLKVSGRAQDAAYRVENGDLVFERTLRGPRNTVLLPAGWEVAGASQPATVGTFRGRAFLAFINHQAEDAMKVQIRARKRPES